MPTALVLGNRRMLVNLDTELQLKDFYYPHIGQDNQLNRYLNRMFLWVDGKIFYITPENCDIEYDYWDDLIVGVSRILFREPGIQLLLRDFVLHNHDIYIRQYDIRNNSGAEKDVRLYFQQNFALNESEYADTVVWYQPAGCLLHYKKDCYLGFGSISKMYQFSCNAKSDNENQGAFPYINGELPYNPVSTGNVNSCISFMHRLKPQESQKGNFYIIAAAAPAEITRQARYLRSVNLQTLFDQTCYYWRDRLNSIKANFSWAGLDSETDAEFNSKLRKNLLRSALIMLTQIDQNGAVVAGNDGQFIKNGGSDTYSYFWPRDGANAVMALCKLGLKEEAQQCLEYALQISGKNGFFLHKYFPAMSKGHATLGSSWHTWNDPQGRTQLPIQEDATALIMIAIVEYYRTFKDRSFINRNWSRIEALLKFLKGFNYRNFLAQETLFHYFSGFEAASPKQLFPDSLLPYPSYDIWEQYLGVFTYTVITILEAIREGIYLVDEVNAKYLKEELIKYYGVVKKELFSKFISAGDRRFIKGMRFDEKTGNMMEDKTPDAAMIFAAVISNDTEIENQLKASLPEVFASLDLKTESGGIARKLDDRYLRMNDTYQGNPWFLTSLWAAEYDLKMGHTSVARQRLSWVMSHTDHTGLMAEQVNAFNGFGLGIKPLTWSHAEFIKTAVAYLKALKR